MITATNKHTGEVVELPANTPEEVVQAWLIAQEYAKTAEALKDQLKKLVPKIVGEQSTSDPINGFVFRISNVQRRNYDKSKLREVLDEDVYDLMVKPDKPAIDKYLKENLEQLGDISTQLRESMIDEGKAYEVIKLERLA
jgi:hypothetical protein